MKFRKPVLKKKKHKLQRDVLIDKQAKGSNNEEKKKRKDV